MTCAVEKEKPERKKFLTSEYFECFHMFNMLIILLLAASFYLFLIHEFYLYLSVGFVTQDIYKKRCQPNKDSVNSREGEVFK